MPPAAKRNRTNVLEHLDAGGLQPAALGVVLHPFRHDTQRQAARELDHRRHHADILRQHIDEYFIDFQNIHRQSFHLLQLVQPGITHAKIIQRNLYPGLAQRSQPRHHILRIVHPAALRHLEDEGARGDAVAGDQL